MRLLIRGPPWACVAVANSDFTNSRLTDFIESFFNTIIVLISLQNAQHIQIQAAALNNYPVAAIIRVTPLNWSNTRYVYYLNIPPPLPFYITDKSSTRMQ